MAAKVAETTADAGPSAFEIKLGINLGRNSPESYETIMVNAETTVNWIFVQAAFVLSHVHNREKNELEKEFDLYLLHHGGHDIALNPARVIADYNIAKNDELQLRRKTLPIPIIINICEGEDKKVEVNSGFPLMDIIPDICQNLDEWLDLLSPLRGQGVEDGDTLYLRKKFFILNDDIHEALEGNQILMDLIYQQILVMFTTENYVGWGSENKSSCTKITALLHHIEQRDENISDESAVYHVMPKHLQKNPDFYEQTVMNYYSENVGSLTEAEAKKVLLSFFSSPQSVLVNYFQVKKSDSSGDFIRLILTVDSDRIHVCQETTSQTSLKVLDSMSWRLRDLRDTECTSQKDKQLRVNILGNWHEFVTPQRTQISRYLKEAQVLTKLRVVKGRTSVVHDLAPRGPDIASEVLSKKQLSPQRSMSGLPNSTPNSAHRHQHQHEPSPIPENPSIHASKSSLVEFEVVEEAGLGILNTEEGREDEAKVEESGDNVPVEEEVLLEKGVPMAEGEVSGSAEEKEEAKEEDREEAEKEEGKLEVGAIKDEATQDSPHDAPSSPAASSPSMTAPPPNSLVSTPHKSASIELCEKESPPQASPAKSSMKSMYMHIPEFLGMDFREVLEDYKLFHIVVMKQDVRTLLLNIKRPIQDVINSLCGTFDIPNASSCYLWIPTGIQSIIEKYGGKPKNRAGRFLKKPQTGRDFSPRLDTSKSLGEQYDFNIKPFLLHLRRYQTEGTDGVDETDCGKEWPEFENPDVARYRSFYQSWTGIVQGAFPIERKGAVKLAAMLTQIYFGDRESHQDWPPRDYDAKIFLPEKHKNAFGIASEVERVHRSLSGKTTQECINDVVLGCRQLDTMKGVFFEVAVPVKSEIFSLIPWNKMEQRWFGVNKNGVFSINRTTGEVEFSHKLSDLSKWTYSENSFKLTFRNGGFDAYTFQTREIVNTLELFTQMVARAAGRQSSEEPEEPEKRSLPPSPTHNTPAPVSFNGSLTGSPHKSHHLSHQEAKPPLNLEIERLQSVISPTTYDL